MKYLTPEPPLETGGDADAMGHLLYREMEIETLARTLWGEARGEGATGMLAVACVILNRVRIAERKGKFWWGNSIIQVCQKPYQFSCWNKSDPNFKKLLQISEDNPYYATALRIARRAIHAQMDDITNCADHYHAAGISPFWTKNQKPVTVIGRHIFYRLEK